MIKPVASTADKTAKNNFMMIESLRKDAITIYRSWHAKRQVCFIATSEVAAADPAAVPSPTT